MHENDGSRQNLLPRQPCAITASSEFALMDMNFNRMFIFILSRYTYPTDGFDFDQMDLRLGRRCMQLNSESV